MDILETASLLFLPLALLLDLVYRARPFAATRFWRLRALVVSGVTFWIAMTVAGFWGETLAGVSLFDLSGLGPWTGAAVGIFVYQIFHYLYHRAEHSFGWLWRWSHQVHHSAESLDAFGANYLSPIDAAVFTSLGSLVFFPLLGVTVEAGIIGATFLAFNAVFQHLNVKTPRWIGYVIQRPESHSLHHARGVHRKNYADLPLVDMMFGTFENPAEFADEVGFERGASARLGAMLIGRDVSRDAAETSEPKRPATRRPVMAAST